MSSTTASAACCPGCSELVFRAAVMSARFVVGAETAGAKSCARAIAENTRTIIAMPQGRPPCRPRVRDREKRPAQRPAFLEFIASMIAGDSGKLDRAIGRDREMRIPADFPYMPVGIGEIS